MDENKTTLTKQEKWHSDDFWLTPLQPETPFEKKCLKLVQGGIWGALKGLRSPPFKKKIAPNWV